MKNLLFLTIFLFLSCSNNTAHTANSKKSTITQEIIAPFLQSILDNKNLIGSILIFDPKKNKYISNDFDWCKQAQLPASTFKIPNTIIGLETGLLSKDTTNFRWDGKDRAVDIWEQDLTLKRAFHLSCVPCYQDLARRIGVTKMNNYVSQFNYGSLSIDSTTIDNFWLTGPSRINQFQQIEFLRSFYNAQLPIAKKTTEDMKNLMVIKEISGYKLSGKTGLSINDKRQNGWFVGYLETLNQVYYFATNIEQKENSKNEFPLKLRKEVTTLALKELTKDINKN